MEKIPRFDRTVGARLKGALDKVIQRTSVGTYSDEDDITSALLESLRDALNYADAGVSASIKSFIVKTTSKGRGTAEARSGADALVSFRLRSSRYDEKKGFLVQAKRVDRFGLIVGRDHTRLLEQCRQMRTHTNESYVWLYGPREFRSVKASSVLASNNCRLDDLYTESPKRLIMDVIKCFRGDTNFSAGSQAELKDILVRTNASLGLFTEIVAKGGLSFRDI